MTKKRYYSKANRINFQKTVPTFSREFRGTTPSWGEITWTIKKEEKERGGEMAENPKRRKFGRCGGQFKGDILREGNMGNPTKETDSFTKV